MKKMACLFVVFLIFAFPVYADEIDDYEEIKGLTFLLTESLKLTKRMDSLAESEYPSVYSGSDEIIETCKEIGNYDYSKPTECYVFSIDPDQYMRSISGVDLPILSDENMEYLRQRIIVSIPTMLNSQYGSLYIATASVLSIGKSYVTPYDPFEPVIVGLYYEEISYMSMVSFYLSGDGVISASAIFVKVADEPEWNVLLPYLGIEYRVLLDSELESILEDA